MTFVAGRRARSVNFGSFAGFTDAPVVEIRVDGVEFDGELTAEEATNIWWWLTSRDDTDEATRRAIASLRDDVATAAVVADCVAVRALVQALADYVLGDMP